MPYVEKTVSLAAVLTGAEQPALVPPGQRMNAISITNVTPGASFQLKVGNNPPATIRGEMTVKIGNAAVASDAQQGLSVINPVAQAGAEATIVISYSRAQDKGGAAAAIVFEAN